MRILFVLSRVPYPLEKGDKLRAYHLIRELSSDHEIVLFCLADEQIHPEAELELKRFCSAVYIHRLPLLTRAWNMIRGLFSSKPFQVEYFLSSKAKKKFDRFLEENLPQHIFCQLIRTAEYARRYRSIPKTIDYMDAFSAGMDKMSQRASSLMRPVMRAEAIRLKRYEEEVSVDFQYHTIISEQDADCIDIAPKIHIIPNGIDPVFFREISIQKSRNLLFAGNMSYRPNVESARFLSQEVMPLLWKKYPSLKLTLAGANPNAFVQSLDSDRIEVTGWVDDIHAVYSSSEIFVAPMLINSGLQNKLLEAMASKIPCITTQLANNALGATPDEHILIGNDAASFAEAIEHLIENPDVADRIASHGHAFATSTYSWTKESKRLEEIMNSHPET